jgi:GDP-4-dehydro-6-deoxy-D-mannose reductase
MKKRILITGVHGFIGHAMHGHLSRDRRLEVFGLTRGRADSKRIIRCDLLNVSSVRSVLKKIRPHVIYHMAGGVEPSRRAMQEVNVTTTKNILEAVKDLGLDARVVVPGSAAEYGKASAARLIKETQEPKPVMSYGAVKWAQTQLALKYARLGMDVVIARIFNISGAQTPPYLAAGRFARQIAGIERKELAKVILTRGLNGQRDFVDIKDVCRGLEMVAERGRRGEIYHIASGRPTKINRLLGILLGLARVKDIEIVEEKEKAPHSFDAIGSFAKLKKLAGWHPQVDLRQSLQNTLRSYRTQ